ncbi:feruloyl-CoA synthase [Pseudorhodoferax soli]|uniref:Feruloyl-CoA synthase n=1 Tax=Pseudorhodoferax soli TaxID=545864 RepID=A0A368XP30_9BURK|nr:feruloyl-CoA synthase [Pseudorhodoferax soli]RCW69605.1 feruloyl-CoA synthase [Pseudorhodoferax soli]
MTTLTHAAAEAPATAATTAPATPPTTPRYRAVPYTVRTSTCERRADGTLVLRSPLTPKATGRTGFAGFIPHWAERRGDLPAFCERDAHSGEWQRITWRHLWQQVQAVGAALLDLGLGQGRPLVVLSPNSLEQLVLLLAAEYVGVAVAPVSPAYSTLSRDFARLKGVCDLVPPAALFVQDAAAFDRAVGVVGGAGVPVITVQGAGGAVRPWSALSATELTPSRIAQVAAAHAAIQPQDIARILFTSGSTGVPKGVPISYANLHATAANLADMLASLAEQDEPPVFLDWLPWHHALGGVLNLGRSVLLGATHYIDDGKPLPGLFERTVRNLREISPTVLTSVPSAWTLLATELERDPQLAKSLFARVISFGYGGASLPKDVNERIQRVAERTVGERIVFGTGLASTETTGVGTYRNWASDDLANIGAPPPGTEIKLVPLEGDRYEIRVRGAHNFSGYVARPDLTAAAFDDEGFFQLGDAVRLVDMADPAKGMRFDGRVAEDFKLVNGTWVRTGAVRLGLVERCAPLITDAVICGHDQTYVAALAWPNVAACQCLLPELAGLEAAALVDHPALLAAIAERLRQDTGSASLRVRRLLLMAEPPSMDANEIADKGYVNQAATRARRAHLVEQLFQPDPGPGVARA